MPLNFSQKLRFKNVPEERIDEFDFIGGLVTDVHETKLKNNQSSDMANVVFTDTHSIKTKNGYSRHNGDPVGIVADQTETGASTGSLAITSSTDYVAQTFIPSGGIDVLQIDAYLAMANSGATQYARIEVWSTSGGAPSALLTNGKSQIKQVSGTGETKYSFRFRKPLSLTATTYAIIVKPVVVASATVNEISVYHRGDTYASGSVFTSSDSGITWANDTAKDLKFTVYSGGSTGNTGLVRYYTTDGTKQMLSKFGDTLYRSDDITGALTELTMPSGITTSATGLIDYVVTNDTLLVVDGDNYIKKYRGSTNADYSTGTITTTNGSTAVIGSGTAWNTSTNAEADEYIKLPDGRWYKIVSIGSDTSLTIETSYQGASLSGESYVISPWGEVQGKMNTGSIPSATIRPQPDFITSHANRIWTIEGNTLRFSALDTSVTEEHFNDWDSANNAGSIIIPSGLGDSCTGLYSLNTSLYIFQRRAIWRLLGTSPNNFELRNVTNEVGLINKSTLVEWDNMMIFLSDLGIYLFDGSNLKNVSDGIINTLINSWADKAKARAVLWDNKYLIAYPSENMLYNDAALYYDIESGVFGKIEDVYVNDWVVWNGGDDNNEIYFGSSNQGTIYRWDVGGNDDGYEIVTRYVTPSYGFGGSMHDKAIKKFYIQQLAVGNWTMNVTQFGNITETETTGASIDLSPGNASLWDVARWDEDEWSGEGAIITTRIAEFQGLNKYFKFKILQEGYNEGIEVLGITLTARMRRLQ